LSAWLEVMIGREERWTLIRCSSRLRPRERAAYLDLSALRVEGGDGRGGLPCACGCGDTLLLLQLHKLRLIWNQVHPNSFDLYILICISTNNEKPNKDMVCNFASLQLRRSQRRSLEVLTVKRGWPPARFVSTSCRWS